MNYMGMGLYVWHKEIVTSRVHFVKKKGKKGSILEGRRTYIKTDVLHNGMTFQQPAGALL